MATPTERLAASLEQLGKLQASGRRVFRSRDLPRVHRERLLRNGFLHNVARGWLISTSPDTDPGDTTPWYASFWEFCARYCAERFGDQWHLSPEQSLLMHAQSTVIPRQVIVYTPKGTNHTISLPFGTSLYDLKQRQMPSAVDLTTVDGLRLYAPETALIKVSQAFFARYPVEARVALSAIRDSSDVLHRLLDGGHSIVAGRLAGAFRRVGRAELADDILGAMRTADYDVRETDPFESVHHFGPGSHAAVPIVGRLQAMWEMFREPVLRIFPAAPGLPTDRDAYIRSVDDIYRSDAYHSLSIEGYRVTPELVERVRSGDWDPDNREVDRISRDALAARGYWEAFQLVRDAVNNVIAGADPVCLADASHRDWYRALFQPCVAAGLIDASALAGYRNDAVFLRGSRHVPPRSRVVRDAMPALFDLLGQETEASVRAVLSHWLFGYIHPYPDGNGRMARFLMNVMLSSGGYPWAVVRVDDRDRYMAALEAASVDSDIRPFANLMSEYVTI